MSTVALAHAAALQHRLPYEVTQIHRQRIATFRHFGQLERQCVREARAAEKGNAMADALVAARQAPRAAAVHRNHGHREHFKLESRPDQFAGDRAWLGNMNQRAGTKPARWHREIYLFSIPS